MCHSRDLSDRIRVLKRKLFDMGERAIFPERLEILKDCDLLASVSYPFEIETRLIIQYNDGVGTRHAVSLSMNEYHFQLKEVSHISGSSDRSDYFGHSYYQYVVSTNGHDLPLPPSIAPASETDYTLSMKSMDRLRKALKENGLVT